MLPEKEELRDQIRQKLAQIPAAQLQAADLKVISTLQTLADQLDVCSSTHRYISYLPWVRWEIDLSLFLQRTFAAGSEVLLVPPELEGVEIEEGDSALPPVTLYRIAEESFLSSLLDLQYRRRREYFSEAKQEGLIAGAAATKLSTTSRNIFLVPGLAFTKKGDRLGRGGGFYDRLLATPWAKNGIKVAVCHEVQVIETLRTESHDVAMNYICTEQQTYECAPS